MDLSPSFLGGVFHVGGGVLSTSTVVGSKCPLASAIGRGPLPSKGKTPPVTNPFVGSNLNQSLDGIAFCFPEVRTEKKVPFEEL